MFLLILIGHLHKVRKHKDFTFHNVSINTGDKGEKGDKDDVFTFHNVSINTLGSSDNVLSGRSLHSTMFLLIHLLL